MAPTCDRRGQLALAQRAGQHERLGLYYLDPGNPGRGAVVVNQVVSVVKNYAVDGVHLDFIRYVGINWGYNPTSVTRFNARYNRTGTPASDDAQWSQWRRDQVTRVVRRIWLEATADQPAHQSLRRAHPLGRRPGHRRGMADPPRPIAPCSRIGARGWKKASSTSPSR